MKVNRIDHSTCREVSSRIHEALQPLAEELGLVIDRGNASYTSQDCSLKLKVSLASEAGIVLTTEPKPWSRYAPPHGLSENDLGWVEAPE